MQRQTAAQTHRYSTGAIVLHWLLALCLAFELALGFAMPKDAGGFALFQLHKSIGITILLLSLVRLGWRIMHVRPPAAESGITGTLAKAVHFGFYAFMILGPLTGWAVASTAPARIPTLLFGIVPLAHLPLSPDLNGLLEDTHELLAWVGLGLFALHLAGALRHHVLLRDRLMERMAPAGSSVMAVGLAALVILVGTMPLLLIGGSAPAPNVAQPAAMTGLADGREAMAPAQPELETEAAPQAEPGEADEQQQSSELEPDEAADQPTAEPGPPPVWTIQPGGRLAFSVADGSGGRISGGFEEWGGTIRFDPENPESAEIRIDIDLSSASVGDPTQDEMLAGEDFFAIANGPTATFRTNSVSETADGRYEAQGTLNLREMSRQQPLSFTLSGEGLRRRVEGSATIDRTAFGIGTGSTAASLGRSVQVEFSFDAVGRRP